MQLLHSLPVFIASHPGLAYGAIFLISLSESLALVGLIIPGTTILFGVGAVLGTGGPGLMPAVLMAGAGAVVGDGISYWLGRLYRDRLPRTWPFSRYPQMLQKGEAFFIRHGGKSVLFGRFVGPVRPVIPLVAGMMRMGPAYFAVVNVVSAAGWALACLLPGAVFGATITLAGMVSTRLAVLGLLLLAILWGFFWLGHRLFRWASHRGPFWAASVEAWAASDRSVPAVLLPAKRFLLFLFGLSHGEELLFAGLLLILFAAGWGFAGVLEDVLSRDPLVLADRAVYHLFQSLRTPWADRIFVAITEFGDSAVNIALAGAVLIVLLVKRCYRSAGFWMLSVLGAVAGVEWLKWTLHLPRPVALYGGASAYGFPSGHTTMSVVLFGFLAVLAARGPSGGQRWWLFADALIFSFLIGISRLYLGAHWLSDVLGGFFIGTSWVSVLGITYLKGARERVPRRWLVFAAAGTFLLAGSWHVGRHHKADLAFYAPRQTVQPMAAETWRNGGWRRLPAWRIDMAGEREQPLTLQWAGSPDELARYLSTRGWRRAAPLKAKNFLAMLTPGTTLAQLPVLPRLHNGRIDRLRLVYPEENRQWVLRLWPSDVRVTGQNATVFNGSLAVQQQRRLAGLITTAEDTGEYDRPWEGVAETLKKRFPTESVARSAKQVAVEHNHSHLQWKGEVLLAWELPGGGSPHPEKIAGSLSVVKPADRPAPRCAKHFFNKAAKSRRKPGNTGPTGDFETTSKRCLHWVELPGIGPRPRPCRSSQAS